MLIRCSSLPRIMVSPRSKGEVLSETAKSEMIKIAKEDFYGYAGLLKGWEELQQTHGPVRLNKYFSHVQDRAVVDDSA